jgi:hypothetical protein
VRGRCDLPASGEREGVRGTRIRNANADWRNAKAARGVPRVRRSSPCSSRPSRSERPSRTRLRLRLRLRLHLHLHLHLHLYPYPYLRLPR